MSGFIVVVGTDYSATGDRAVDYALRFCAARPDAVVHVVHAAKSEGNLVRLELGGVVKHVPVNEAQAHLANVVYGAVAELSRAGLKLQPAQVSNHVRAGQASDALIELARDVAADLLIVGTHGRRGVRRMLLGSVAEDVARRANCPVLVVRPKEYGDA